MASQDARFSKFESDFKQQQIKMTNKIDTLLKAINDRMTGELPSDTVKNPKLNVNSTSLVLSARSYLGRAQNQTEPTASINRTDRNRALPLEMKVNKSTSIPSTYNVASKKVVDESESEVVRYQGVKSDEDEVEMPHDEMSRYIASTGG
ncbi:hypothetical protein Tco_1563438 [Tanacetum coccineum]